MGRVKGYVVGNFVVFFLLWLLTASLKVMCSCRWNDYGPAVAGALAICLFTISSLAIKTVLKHRKNNILIYYIWFLVISIATYIYIARLILSLEWMMVPFSSGRF